MLPCSNAQISFPGRVAFSSLGRLRSPCTPTQPPLASPLALCPGSPPRCFPRDLGDVFLTHLASLPHGDSSYTLSLQSSPEEGARFNSSFEFLLPGHPRDAFLDLLQWPHPQCHTSSFLCYHLTSLPHSTMGVSSSPKEALAGSGRCLTQKVDHDYLQC